MALKIEYHVIEPGYGAETDKDGRITRYSVQACDVGDTYARPEDVPEGVRYRPVIVDTEAGK